MKVYKGHPSYVFSLLRLFPIGNSFNYDKIARKKSSISEKGGKAYETFEKEVGRADVAEYVRQRRAVYDIGFGSGIVDPSTRRLFSIAYNKRIWIISSCSLQNLVIHFKMMKKASIFAGSFFHDQHFCFSNFEFWVIVGKPTIRTYPFCNT